MLTGPQLDDFIRTYKIAFDEVLTPEEANEMYLRLLHLYRSIKRIPDEGREEEADTVTSPSTDPEAPPAVIEY